MINKELKNEAREIEALTADDKKLRQMLGGLKKVCAPKNFDFHLKARIANAKPEDLRQPFLLPWLRYVLPLSVIVLLAGFAFFNLSFSTGNQNAPEVASDLPPNPNETANASVEMPSNIIVEEPLTASVPANKNSEIRTLDPELIRSENKATQNKARAIVVKNSLAAPSNKRENDPKNNSSGSRDITLKDAPVLFERNANPNSENTKLLKDELPKIPLPLQEILSQLGVKADYTDRGWKIVSLKEKSPAMISGMKVGDFIEAIDDKKLSSDTVFQQAFTGKVFRIMRDGKQLLIELNAK